MTRVDNQPLEVVRDNQYLLVSPHTAFRSVQIGHRGQHHTDRTAPTSTNKTP